MARSRRPGRVTNAQIYGAVTGRGGNRARAGYSGTGNRRRRSSRARVTKSRGGQGG